MKKIKLSEIKKKKQVNSSIIALEFVKKGLDLEQENFVLIGMDQRNQVKFTKTLFKGGISKIFIDIKLILKEVIINGCSSFIVGHNHPSNDLTPSREDIKMTQDLKEVSKLLNLRLLDHFIFNEGEYISFFDEDLL